MTEIRVVPPGGGEPIDLGPIRIEIVEDGSTTEHRLGAALIHLRPHTSGPPPHWHERHDEGFYVVSGTATFATTDATHTAPPGTFVMVPTRAVHTFRNDGDEECVLLNTFTPDLYVQYFRDLAHVAASGDPLTGSRILSLMRNYSTFPAGNEPANGQ
jgi:mannose-6-phosphate isomerase-like protein (cupin superfamily)